PEGDSLPIGEAATAKDPCISLRAKGRQELVDEPRLPDACSSQNGKEVTRRFSYGSFERVREGGSLPFPADHRRVQATNDAFDIRPYIEKPESGYRLLLSLEGEGIEGFHVDCIPGQLPRGPSDQDVPRLRGLLQTSSHV